MKYLILLLISISLISCQDCDHRKKVAILYYSRQCKKLTYENNMLKNKIKTLATIKQEQPTQEIVVDNLRVWSSRETKLPRGTVITMDCASCYTNTNNRDVKDNYVTIKRDNGTLTIVKDIDDDLFLNLKTNDLIR